MEENLTRQIKIFCPTHQSVFEVADSPKIVCEIKEHALSNDFPNAEFWEYCCDCQTFFPSDLEVGGKAKSACPQCERPMLSRFVCGNCKIVSYDSGEDTKGKIFTVNVNEKTVEPSCAGCSMIFSGIKLQLHKCEEAEAVFLTSRQTCPFCKKETVKPKPKPEIKAPPVIKCQKCQTNNEADSFFCNNCGEELRSNPQLSKRGTSTAKTQLLGSICPNCGTGNRPNVVFCANCGQGLKVVLPTPKPQPVPTTLPPPIPPQVVNTNAVGNLNPSAKAKSSNTNGCLAAIGILFGVIVLCVIFQGILSTKNTTISTANTIYNSNSNSNKANNSYMSNTLTMNSNNAMDSNVASSNSSLSTSFSRDYAGTIGGRSFSMSLTRDGNDLRGTASTNKTDYLYGTIDSDGSFTLKAYENDKKLTGNYSGRIDSDGSISGTWTNLQGEKSTSFSLSLSE